MPRFTRIARPSNVPRQKLTESRQKNVETARRAIREYVVMTDPVTPMTSNEARRADYTKFTQFLVRRLHTRGDERDCYTDIFDDLLLSLDFTEERS